MTTVEDLRQELMNLGLTEEEANNIKGKSNLSNKLEELKVKEESLKDTLIDNAVYSLLCIILYEDEKEKKNRSKNFRRS